ncbi:HAMP domain-containing histidine kinase [Candidatus Woesearchaeota archaeon]|nr:HAMP domain-containing histidine kinase [Candidatus Woesearchaeota archaeon]HIH37554.1 HAMP domain-containing histidine kinase [Candidatus Woesearchaeota archaeon]HIH47967.1 HAMP domain-containing histidine kinase [Candidatus Woesearchaeota archaeon]HIJ03705.1 HAMP domain-containing histidine kinase [Candidatus Woesearchaeota archaeon]
MNIDNKLKVIAVVSLMIILVFGTAFLVTVRLFVPPQFSRAQQAANLLFLIFAIAISCYILLITYITARAVSTPIHVLHEATRKVQAGVYSVRVNILTGDELQDLGSAFNEQVRELEQLEKNREELENAKKMFLALAAHELKSPLTATEMQLEMLDTGQFGKVKVSQKESIAVARRNLSRLHYIITDILDLTRLEAAQLNFERQKCSLKPYLLDLIHEMKAYLPEKKITLKTRISNLPAIFTDPNRLIQAIRNLLTNAYKFSPKKGIVSLSIKDEGNHLLFRVEDQGPGIEKENWGRVFEPFFQEKASLSRQYGGVGLGLSVCKGIIDSQGGKIWIEGEKGSTFVFTLPIKSSEHPRPVALLFSSGK